MRFDNDLEQYVYEYDDLVFVWDEPPKDYQEQIKILAENYHKNFNEIIHFMLPDILEVYGDVCIDEMKEKLGRAFIDIDHGQVNYLEQTFDDIHIFTFEFLDDQFEKLDYFSIDG